MKRTFLLVIALMLTIALGAQKYKSEEVEFANGDATLSGTLLTPKDVENPPVVLMVTGSGQQNRDEEILGHKPFKVIAEYLAERGIASLRYDDRGFGKSTGSLDGVTTETFKQDALSGVEYLKTLRAESQASKPRFSKVGVLGHSEGGTIAFLIAADGKADFIVSLAGGGVQGKETILTQNYNALKAQGIPSDQVGEVVDAVEDVFNKIIASPLDEPMSQTLQKIAAESENPEIAQTLAMQLGSDANGKWFKYFLALNPAEAISKITCPVMALNGTKDFQVDCEENLGSIKKHLPESPKNLVKSYEGLNHLFQKCTTGYPTEYAIIKEDIAEVVLSDISIWIKSL